MPSLHPKLARLMGRLCDTYTPEEVIALAHDPAQPTKACAAPQLLDIFGEMHSEVAQFSTRDLQRIMLSLREIRADEYGDQPQPHESLNSTNP